MEVWLARLEQAVWGWPLLLLILGTGLYLTLRLRLLPLRRLGMAMRLLFRKGTGTGVSPFAALCTSLSATVGTGNIVGVATALVIGGPGALLWMELSAVICMSLKYAEGLLAVRFRETRPDGSRFGGPFTYITQGLGRRWRPLAAAFALLGTLAGLLGVGTFVQIGSVTACLRGFLDRCFPRLPRVLLLGQTFPAGVPVLAVLLTVGTAAVVFRDVRSISRLSAVLVPVMGGLYLLCCLWILGAHAKAIPGVLARIVKGALRPGAAAGGLLGTVQAGVSRGIFSNEAGLGTAPIAAACAEGVSPAEQGLVSMTASVFDTLLVCTLTGLAILSVGGSLQQGGALAAMEAFSAGLPLPERFSRALVTLCLTLFAFTTVVGWSFYGARCLAFLTGGARLPERLYLLLYVLTVPAAPFFPIRSVWTAANILNGLMAVPNILGILLLSPCVLLDSHAIMKPREGRQRDGTAVFRRSRGRLRQARGPAVHG